MAEQETTIASATINGEDQPSEPTENDDVEESMEIQTIQTVGGANEMDDMKPSRQCDVVYDDFKLFVGGLTNETNKSNLEEYFKEYGTIVEIIVKGGETGTRSKYAFIRFKEETAVTKIIEEKPHMINGKTVDLKKAIPHDLHQQMKLRTKKIFVGGVPTDMAKETIESYFEQFGDITDVALVTDKGVERRRRGFCFVTFKKEDTADEVCKGEFHKIGSTTVEVKRATPREQEVGKRGPNHSGRGGGRGHPPFMPNRGGGISPNFAPYGGHAYFPFYQPTPGYPGGYMSGYSNYGGGGGYGGYTTYEYGGGGRRDDSGYNSRYGPMRSYTHHNHGHGHGGSFHPYSR